MQLLLYWSFFFFFQAEDGIRDLTVTGVQTCALPILLHQGVALEAHGQNTLVLLRSGRPARIWYRDVGGVRLSPARLGGSAPPLHGDLATDDPEELRTKLLAALTAVLGELAATMTRENGTPPATVWRL